MTDNKIFTYLKKNTIFQLTYILAITQMGTKFETMWCTENMYMYKQDFLNMPITTALNLLITF